MDKASLLDTLADAGVSTLHILAVSVGLLVLLVLILSWLRIRLLDREEARSNERLANYIEGTGGSPPSE